MEALADAGVRVGLPRQLALTLVAQTALGAARMVQTTGRHPAALRDDVTTPAGCTIAGLLMLEDGRIRSVLARAVEEAAKIAAQLGPAGQVPKPRHARAISVQSMTNSESSRLADELIEIEDRWGARNYLPWTWSSSGPRASGSTAWMGERYLDCLSAYSALNQGHCHPRIIQALQEQAARITLTSRAFRNDQLPAVHRGTGPAVRHADGAADEHRRRSGGDGHQSGSPLGIRPQGHSTGSGRDHRLREQLSRADHHHHRLFLRAALPGRVRPLHSRIRDRAVRRCGGAGARDHAEHLRFPVRADSVRGRHPDSARWISERRGGNLPARAGPDGRRRDPDRTRAEPDAFWPASTRESSRTC